MPYDVKDDWSAEIAERMKALLDDDAPLRVLVATVGDDRLPHLATADHIVPHPDGLVQVWGWLCPRTVRNLKQNTKLALVVRAEQGSIQIEGRVEDMEEDAILDGYAPSEAADLPIPQVRWVLHVHPERFFRFTDGQHSDQPLGQTGGA